MSYGSSIYKQDALYSTLSVYTFLKKSIISSYYLPLSNPLVDYKSITTLNWYNFNNKFNIQIKMLIPNIDGSILFDGMQTYHVVR